MAEELQPVDIHISTDEFEQILAGTQESGYIKLTYNPNNPLHTKIIDAALDTELIDEEPEEGDEIEFSADFNIFLMNLADVTNNGPAEGEDPGAAGGKRRNTGRRKTRRTKKYKSKK